MHGTHPPSSPAVASPFAAASAPRAWGHQSSHQPTPAAAAAAAAAASGRRSVSIAASAGGGSGASSQRRDLDHDLSSDATSDVEMQSTDADEDAHEQEQEEARRRRRARSPRSSEADNTPASQSRTLHTPPRVAALRHSSPSASGSAVSPYVSPAPSPSVSTAAGPTKRVKLKQALSGLKEKWANLKFFKKKSTAPPTPSSAVAPVAMPVAAAAPILTTHHSVASSPEAPPPSHVLRSHQSAPAPLSPLSLALSPPTSLSSRSPSPSLSPSPLTLRQEQERQKAADAAAAESIKESARMAEYLQKDLARVEKRQKQEQEAIRKREEKQRKADERKAADLVKQQARMRADAAKQMKQLLEKAAMKPTQSTMESLSSATSSPPSSMMIAHSASANDLQHMHEAPTGSRPSKHIELLALQDRRPSATALALPVVVPRVIASPEPSSASSVHRLGFLQLHFVQGRQINGKDDRDAGGERWKQKTRVEVLYGGCTYQSEWHAGSNPQYGYRLALPVFDLEHDVVVRFVLKHSLKKNEVFGMIALPITSLINRQGLWHGPPTEEEQRQHLSPLPPGMPLASLAHPDAAASPALPPASLTQRASTLLSSLFSKRDFVFSEWIQLFPVGHDTAGTLWLHRFPAAEDTILASGMERPKKELGRVRLTATLHLEEPLSFAYMQVDSTQYDQPEANGVLSPSNLIPARIATPSHPMVMRPEEPLDFSRVVLKKNAKRIQRWLASPNWFRVFCQIFTWRVPILSFYFLALWTYVCFGMPAYLYPLFAVVTCCLTNVWIKRYRLEEYAYVKTYQGDALPSNYIGEGKWRKFQRYKGVLVKTSYVVGRVASALEKTSNLLNFTDTALSILAYLILLFFATMFSLLLYFVPANVCVFLAGLWFFARGAAETLRAHLQRPTPEETSSPSKTDTARPIASTNTYLASARRFKAACSALFKHLALSLRYLYRRSPDYYELAHRILCERAITATQSVQLLSPSPPGAVATISVTAASAPPAMPTLVRRASEFDANLRGSSTTSPDLGATSSPALIASNTLEKPTILRSASAGANEQGEASPPAAQVLWY